MFRIKCTTCVDAAAAKSVQYHFVDYKIGRKKNEIRAYGPHKQSFVCRTLMTVKCQNLGEWQNQSVEMFYF